MKLNKTIFERVYDLGNAIIRYLAAIIMFGVFIFTFFFQCRISMEAVSMEKVSFVKNDIWVYIFIAIIIFFLILSRDKIRNIESKKLYILLSVLLLILGLILIKGIGTDLRTDANKIYEAATMFSKGDFSYLEKGGYLYHYPHQLGMVTYERILLKLVNNKVILFVSNLLFVLLINWTNWKISQELFEGNLLTQNLTIIFGFFFFPQMFFIAFAYGTIPGFAFFLLAIYFQILFLKIGKNKYLVLTFLFATVATMLKNNYLIGAISIACVFILAALKKKKIRMVVYGVLMMGLVLLSGEMLNKFYEVESGYSIEGGEPKTLWIAMGLRDESSKLGGWYDGFNYSEFEKNNYDSKQSGKVAMESIIESFDRFRKSPQYTIRFFRQKIESTWCDPLFQSIWSGPLEATGQKVKSEKISYLYKDTLVHKLIRDFCGAWLIIIYGMFFLFFLRKSKENTIIMTGVIFFLGGFLFHLVWETKSQYVYPYVFCMIPYACYMLDNVLKKIEKFLYSKESNVKNAVKNDKKTNY